MPPLSRFLPRRRLSSSSAADDPSAASGAAAAAAAARSSDWGSVDALLPRLDLRALGLAASLLLSPTAPSPALRLLKRALASPRFSHLSPAASSTPSPPPPRRRRRRAPPLRPLLAAPLRPPPPSLRRPRPPREGPPSVLPHEGRRLGPQDRDSSELLCEKLLVPSKERSLVTS
uniref:Uncharacterized protein n=1 Tax=Ananas comosus var. bracteatus TaxID=296719 RepID=A0A6V7NW62_ANACO|nr:unnamed protein product [Ananas comosus var. bracteatus]